MPAKQKLTLYFPPTLLEEAKVEAERQERTVSWILQKAWEYARKDIQKLPGVGEPVKPSLERKKML